MDRYLLSGIRCHKCRYDLQVASEALTRAHEGSCAYGDNSNLFLSEERLPSWIRGRVEAEGWTKGKLHCPGCGGRVGSFDFLAGRQCACGGAVLPAVHLVRSQVDTALRVSDLLRTSDNIVT